MEAHLIILLQVIGIDPFLGILLHFNYLFRLHWSKLWSTASSLFQTDSKLISQKKLGSL